MKVFYCGSSTIRKILLNGVLVLVYNSSIDKQENTMSKARQEVQELVERLLKEADDYYQNSNDASNYALGYITGILKDIAEDVPGAQAVVQSFLNMKR